MSKLIKLEKLTTMKIPTVSWCSGLKIERIVKSDNLESAKRKEIVRREKLWKSIIQEIVNHHRERHVMLTTSPEEKWTCPVRWRYYFHGDVVTCTSSSPRTRVEISACSRCLCKSWENQFNCKILESSTAHEVDRLKRYFWRKVYASQIWKSQTVSMKVTFEHSSTGPSASWSNVKRIRSWSYIVNEIAIWTFPRYALLILKISCNQEVNIHDHFYFST